MTQNTETQALTDDDLVERLRKRAADDRGFQKNNEAVAVALKAKLAKAVQLIDDIFSDHGMDECVCELCTSYVERRAELTGGKDE